MIVVPVAQNDMLDPCEVEVQPGRVLEKGGGLPGVEEEAVAVGFDEKREAVLRFQGVMLAGFVFNQGDDPEHGRVLSRSSVGFPEARCADARP